MDMKFGPDGSLYVLDYGSTWFDKSDDSKVVRIEYTAGNRTPVAAASSDRTGGVAPVEIGLSADGSIDHDGDPLRHDIHSDIGGGDVAPCPLGGSWRLGRRRARCCFGGSDGRHSARRCAVGRLRGGQRGVRARSHAEHCRQQQLVRDQTPNRPHLRRITARPGITSALGADRSTN
jgi:hypothetical protein